MSILQRVALPVVIGAAAVAMAAQEPRIYTPDSPPAAGEVTVLNTKVVGIDEAGRRMTVTVDRRARDGRVDRAATRTFAVAERGAAALSGLRKGTEVMLTLRGETVIDVRVTTPGAGAGRPGEAPGTGVISTGGSTTTIERGGGTVTTGAGGATTTTTTTTGTVTITEPAPAVSPAVPVPPVSGPAVPRTAVSPAPAGPTRPPVSPVAVPTPQPVSTPRPVILPSDPPPTPIPSPSPPPTPPPTAPPPRD